MPTDNELDELDRLIATQVMGWTLKHMKGFLDPHIWCAPAGGIILARNHYRPTRDPAKAIEALEKWQDDDPDHRSIHELHRQDGHEWFVELWICNDTGLVVGGGQGRDKSLPLAVCRALREAMEGGEQ